MSCAHIYIFIGCAFVKSFSFFFWTCGPACGFWSWGRGVFKSKRLCGIEEYIYTRSTWKGKPILLINVKVGRKEEKMQGSESKSDILYIYTHVGSLCKNSFFSSSSFFSSFSLFILYIFFSFFGKHPRFKVQNTRQRQSW